METYSAHHSETVEELLRWPWRRFERFYEAFIKREIVESLERRRDDMISALWANSNYDDDKGTRTNAIQEITQNFDEAIGQIFNINIDDEEEEIDDDNPFFQAAKKGQEKLLEEVNYSAAADADTLVKDVVDYSSIDQ